MIDRLFKHRPLSLAFVVMGIIVLCLAVVVQNELDTRDAQDARVQSVVEVVAREQLDRRVRECQSTNRSRAALQAVLEQVADPPPAGAAAVDFSEVPGWDALGPDVKFFLSNLTVALNEADPNYISQVADKYEESNPQADCLKLEESLRATLEKNYPN